MRKALLAKFSQHYGLRQNLLETGTRKLIEHSPYDSFWGNGGNDQGQNHLGELLMEIRNEIRMTWKGDGNSDSLGNTQLHQAVDTDHVSGHAAQMDNSPQPMLIPPHNHQEIGNGSQIDPNSVPGSVANFTNAPSFSNLTSGTPDPNLAAPSPQIQDEPTAGTGVRNLNLAAAEDGAPMTNPPNGNISVVESEESNILNVIHQPSEEDNGGQTKESDLVVDKPEPASSQNPNTDPNHVGDVTKPCLVAVDQVPNDVASNEQTVCLLAFVREIVEEIINNAVQRVVDESTETNMEIEEEKPLSPNESAEPHVTRTTVNVDRQLGDEQELPGHDEMDLVEYEERSLASQEVTGDSEDNMDMDM